MAKKIIPIKGQPNDSTTAVPFMTTLDEGRIMPGDDDEPGMLINSAATPGALFAIAQSRLDNVADMLRIIAVHDSDAGYFADMLCPYLQEVLMLLGEGNNRLHAQREVAHA